jgi:hypothetical protein
VAKIFNPWESPSSSGALTGDLASFEINEVADQESMQEDSDEMSDADTGHGAIMQQALQVISQQAALIDSLMKTLGK